MKQILFDVFVEAALAKTFVAFPFLNIPIIRQLYTFIFKFVALKIYDEAALRGAYLNIEVMTASERIAYDYAVNELRVAMITTDNQEVLNEAIREFKERLGRLIDFNY